MAIQQILQESLEHWKLISKLDYCLLDLNQAITVSTRASVQLPSEEFFQTFLDSDAESCVSGNSSLLKVSTKGDLSHVLMVTGSSDAFHTIAELAVCQVESLLDAYREKNDKNIYLQNLLLGNYTVLEIHNKAKKMHISSNGNRCVMLIHTKDASEENVLSTIRNIFSSRSNDFVTTLNNEEIVIIREMSSTETMEDLMDTSFMLVDMLNTEVMTKAWVSFGNMVTNLEDIPNAFKEARTAMEVGKIFNSHRNVFSYSQLGIGRLIYQLPISICEMFIDEIFQKSTLDSLDDETLLTIKIFFENNLNLSETSRQLYVHRNTLVYRFEKLQKKFGLDIRTFEDALTFKLAMMVVDYINYKKAKKESSD